MAILVTGGTGYIGSHTVLELLNANYDVVIADNLCNSHAEVLNRIKQISNCEPRFCQVNVCDYGQLEQVFKENKITAVIHFAGLKSVPESVKVPLQYYQNNLVSTMNLLEIMQKYGVKNFVFSSSATVYGDPLTVPITENFPLSATNPYGKTKLFTEEIIRDFCFVNKDFNVAILRYFNPIGAHSSGLIGEDPMGIPNNLIPYIAQVAVGKREFLHVFGNDYPTPDGTGIRDYIHVVDLANGHLRALEKLNTNCGLVTYNLGTGIGYSVLDVVSAYEKASGIKIPYQIEPRRPGDVAECYANPQKAREELNWETKLDLHDMCASSYYFQSMNPHGYKK